MTNANATGLTPAEEDPILHRYLSLLPVAVPTAGLGERVLSGVWRPAPRWVRRSRAAIDDMVASGRIWLVIGAFAVGSLVPLAASLVLVRVFSDSIGVGLRWFTAEGLPFAWVAVRGDVQWVAAKAAGIPGELGLTVGDLRAAGISTVVMMIACAVGLRRTMMPSRKDRP